MQLLHMLKANPGSEQALPIEYLDHIVSKTDPEDLEKVFFFFSSPYCLPLRFTLSINFAECETRFLTSNFCKALRAHLP